jgi:lipoprotein-releasing system ATP-binding protein
VSSRRAAARGDFRSSARNAERLDTCHALKNPCLSGQPPRIGFIFQYHNLLAGFTAVENVMMPMLGDAGCFNEDMERRAAELLDNVGLARWRDSMVTQLSGGQQQRVAVARSLAMDPPLLLADEPTGNLDTKAADAVFELLQKANRERGMAILFVTHNPELARRCDRIIQVVDGQIQA